MGIHSQGLWRRGGQYLENVMGEEGIVRALLLLDKAVSRQENHKISGKGTKAWRLAKKD